MTVDDMQHTLAYTGINVRTMCVTCSMSPIVQKEQKQPQWSSVCNFKRFLKLDYSQYIIKTQDDVVAGIK